jgi:hypothetical protein
MPVDFTHKVGSAWWDFNRLKVPAEQLARHKCIPLCWVKAASGEPVKLQRGLPQLWARRGAWAILF